MRQPLEKFVAPVVVNDRLRNDRAEDGHPFGKPRRNAPAVERKIGASGSPSHQLVSSCVLSCKGPSPVLRVRNVSEYRKASTAGMLCSHSKREGPDMA